MQAGPPEGGRYWETYYATVVALIRVLECWRASDLPSPCFLKVPDFKEDESVCFDRDLEVLIVGMLRVSGGSVLDVYELTTGGSVCGRNFASINR